MGEEKMRPIDKADMKYYNKFTIKQLEEVLLQLSEGKKEEKKRILNVYANKEKNELSFQIKGNMSLYTGVKGFLKFTEDPLGKFFDEIYMNGIQLDKNHLEDFWQWIENIRDYEENLKKDSK